MDKTRGVVDACVILEEKVHRDVVVEVVEIVTMDADVALVAVLARGVEDVIRTMQVNR